LEQDLAQLIQSLSARVQKAKVLGGAASLERTLIHYLDLELDGGVSRDAEIQLGGAAGLPRLGAKNASSAETEVQNEGAYRRCGSFFEDKGRNCGFNTAVAALQRDSLIVVSQQHLHPAGCQRLRSILVFAPHLKRVFLGSAPSSAAKKPGEALQGPTVGHYLQANLDAFGDSSIKSEAQSLRAKIQDLCPENVLIYVQTDGQIEGKSRLASTIFEQILAAEE